MLTRELRFGQSLDICYFILLNDQYVVTSLLSDLSFFCLHKQTEEKNMGCTMNEIFFVVKVTLEVLVVCQAVFYGIACAITQP